MPWRKASLKNLKSELIYQQDFQTQAMAKQAIFEYIEVWYNGSGHPAPT